jgi:anti-sigma factor RsiW
VERHRALRARLAAHYAPVLEAPLPDRLRQAVMPPEATVVDLAQARARRTRRLTWGGGIGLALAASLTLAVVLQAGRRNAAAGYADGALASALDNQLPARRRLARQCAW